MINFYTLSILLLLLVNIQTKAYQRIKDYDSYLRLWEQKKENVIIHDVSNLGPNKDKCGWNTCKFVYYEYKQKQELSSIYNRTVLMVSGMHGNEFIGPHVLLYGFEHFIGAHIIYFPIVNPSGFQRQERVTFPQKLDPNRDYPIDGNTDCYQTYSTIVIDHIFRKYSIDITFVLHNGGNQIGFNWGTIQHQSKSHTEDYEIQLPIAEMMKREGGSNKELGIQKFKVGTMSQVIYPATGTFDDWAFAASKYPSVITKCKNHKFQPYPSNMTNGLVFLIELGPHNNELFGSSQAVELGAMSSKDGYVSRGIRLLKLAIQIVNPSLHLKIKQNNLQIVVKGCSSAEITKFDMFQRINQKESILLFTSKQSIQVEGTVRKNSPKPFIIALQQNLQNNTNIITYRGSFICSKQWQGKGTTFFASNRKYEFNQQVNFSVLSNKDIQILIDDIKQLEWYEELEIQKYALYLVILLGVLVLMSAIFALLRCICAKKTVKKQQQTQYQQEEMYTGQDLYTARGGIINQNI